MKTQLSDNASSLQLQAIPAFNDNYIWLMHNGQHALVVDPGDAQPVIDVLNEQQLQLAAILITHHHHDHVGGLAQLVKTYPQCPVFGPVTENIPHRTEALQGGENVSIPALNLKLLVLSIPGHTLGHLAYFGYKDSKTPVVFCGDTLFSGGCGRVFEGSPAQMMHSLQSLAALPATTLVCCAHEYTLSNVMWALDVEPDNQSLHDYYQRVCDLRESNTPTLPSTIKQELAINPFLRTHVPTVQLNAAKHSTFTAKHNTDVFTQLREWKNNA